MTRIRFRRGRRASLWKISPQSCLIRLASHGLQWVWVSILMANVGIMPHPGMIDRLDVLHLRGLSAAADTPTMTATPLMIRVAVHWGAYSSQFFNHRSSTAFCPFISFPDLFLDLLQLFLALQINIQNGLQVSIDERIIIRGISLNVQRTSRWGMKITRQG